MNIDIQRHLLAMGVPEECISQMSSAGTVRRFSIRPLRGEEIWRVFVDGCWIRDNVTRRVDYLFWARTSSGQHIIILVELKGGHFTDALEQIEQMLQLLATYKDTIPSEVEKRAYAVLSHGRGVPQATNMRERLRKRYGVRVVAREKRIEVDGIESLPL